MKKVFLTLLFVFRLLQSQAQIDDAFYGMCNLHIVAQPYRSSLGLQLIDWTVADPGRFGMFMDAKVRLISDMINIKKAPLTENEPNFIGGWFEMRIGFNLLSRDKFNTGIGLSPINIWTVISSEGYRRGVAILGLCIKHDQLLSKNFMLRTMVSPDFKLFKSSGSDLEQHRINLLSFELIHKSGFYGGIDFIRARYSGISNAPAVLSARRLELKLGVKLVD
jgi:hypothetical protein